MTTFAQDELQSNRQPATADPNAVIVAEWPLNKRDNVRVSIEKYNGVWLINLRKWFEAEDGELRPSKQGIALGLKHLPQLVEAITAALSIARDRDLVPAAALDTET